MCRLSVIVPVYNVEEYIDKCLHTLSNQTLNDIEIIIVNDGSNDNSQAIIDKYVSENPDRMRSFQKENGGLADARNYGLQYAKGEYLGFVDPDDWVEIDMYEKMYNYAKERNADMVISDFIFEPNGSIVNSEISSDIELNLKDNPELLLIEPSVCNKIFKRSLFNDYSIDFPFGLVHEDRLTIAKLYYYSKRIFCIGEAFYHYLKNRENSNTTSRNIKKFMDIIVILDRIEQFFIKQNFIKSVQSSLETLYLNSYISFCIRAINEINDYDLRNTFLEKFRGFFLDRFNQTTGNDTFRSSNLQKKVILLLLINRRYALANFLTKIKKFLRG